MSRAPRGPRRIALTPARVRALAPVFREAEANLARGTEYGVVAQVWLRYKPRRAELRAAFYAGDLWHSIQAAVARATETKRKRVARAAARRTKP